jgi:crotonobetainyl-CoA:carnitine CoA-transferase CaiB-like acyl-CoA transferase
VLVEHGGAAIARPPTGSAGYPRILTPDRRPQRTADGWASLFPYTPEQVHALLEAGRNAGSRPHGEVEGEEVDGEEDEAVESVELPSAEHQPEDEVDYRASPGLLYRRLDEVAGTRTTEEWLAFCRERGIPAAAVVSLDELVDQLPDARHPVAGDFKVIPPPVRFSATPASVRRVAPLPGQDNGNVLEEVGLSAEEIDALSAAGVLRRAGSAVSPDPRQ